MSEAGFEWDEEKNRQNLEKHGVPFDLAQYAFGDPDRIIRRWDLNGSFHLPEEQNPHYRCGILEKRKRAL